MNSLNTDIVVIGAGPGGYVAAVRAAQLGQKVICVERAELGGVCLNWGCIPTKALLKSAEYMHFLKKPNEYGFKIDNIEIDFPQVIKRSRDVAARMSQGIAFLFKKYGVQYIKGSAYIKGNACVEVRNENDELTDHIETKNIVIATGSRPRMFQGIEVDRKNILTSKEALVVDKIPESIIVMGAGAIGVEFSYFFNAFGSQVTIIEMQDRLLPIEDADTSKELERNYRKDKIRILTSTRVLSAKPAKEGVEVVIEKKDGTQETLNATLALNAIGIQTNWESLGLENIGITDIRGGLTFGGKLEIAPAVFAIGDVASAPWLAHKASAEGIAVAEYICSGKEINIDYGNIPGCTYCSPQVASVGLTETKAKEQGFELRIGKFQFTACGKAHAIGDARGFVKLIFDAKTDLILGAHLIGPEVTELLAELCLARKNNITAKQIIDTIHAHPTLSEAIMEASAVAHNEAVNC